MVSANILRSTTVFFNIGKSANQHIRMISEKSCDTEDWSNDICTHCVHSESSVF